MPVIIEMFKAHTVPLGRQEHVTPYVVTKLFPPANTWSWVTKRYHHRTKHRLLAVVSDRHAANAETVPRSNNYEPGPAPPVGHAAPGEEATKQRVPLRT